MFPSLLLFASLVWVAGAGDVSKQFPLGGHSTSSPFDEVFDEKVVWALKHFRVPGLSIAVVHGNETFFKVRS